MLDVRAISGYYNQIRLARSMGSGDDMFRTWSGPEGSSHKEPLPGTRSHRAHGAFFRFDSHSALMAFPRGFLGSWGDIPKVRSITGLHVQTCRAAIRRGALTRVQCDRFGVRGRCARANGPVDWDSPV